MWSPMRPTFADPKTDFVFKRLFGSEQHKALLVALLDALLELDEAHCIVDVELLDAGQRPAVAELKYSIVDVKCRDAQGTTYVVEMQVLNVEGFEKRVVYNVAKAYTNQLSAAAAYPSLDDVIGVTICDFELWPGSEVPMLSRWRMQEQHGGARGLSQLQFVFLELPKYRGGERPERVIDRWAYFFREAQNLAMVPEVLARPPFDAALEATRAAGFSEEEWDAYLREGIALQDERGALSLARKEGAADGLVKGIEAMCEVLGVEIDAARREALDARGVTALETILVSLREERRWPD